LKKDVALKKWLLPTCCVAADNPMNLRDVLIRVDFFPFDLCFRKAFQNFAQAIQIRKNNKGQGTEICLRTI
jgi:hypothetical protein